MRRNVAEKDQEARVKWWNSNINRHQRFWDYNNKLWRWSSESEAQEHLLESYCTSLGVNFSKPKDNYLLTRINATNQNSLDFDHLDHTSNLPNALVRYKVTVFSLHTMTYSLGYTSYPHIPLTPLFWSGVFILQNLSTRNLRGVSYLRKFRRQGAVKLWNSTIKGHQRFWDYNNKLWRWSSGSEAQEHLLEIYWTSLGTPNLETKS